ncbi:MAG: DM13 domain-containing protein [Leptolyngbyaceae bacterium]|nr:DM13 domain-containing protein [Leptolyngbyaceae bacterium]
MTTASMMETNGKPATIVKGGWKILNVDKQDGQNWDHNTLHNQPRLVQDRALRGDHQRICRQQGRLGAIALALLLATACTPKNESRSPSTPPDSSSPEASTDSTTIPPSADPAVTPVSPTVVPEPLGQPESDPKNTTGLDSLPIVPTTPLAPPSIDTATLPAPKTLEAFPPLAKGTFASEANNTQGTFTILDDEGTAIIQFDQNFQTAPSPDLFVVLHVADDLLAITSPPNYGLKDGDYVAIAPLKAPQGTQAYSIPAAIILENYNSLAIWDRRLNTTLGMASLEVPTN